MTEILNFVIIFLLTVAIIYGFILNRKINLIHESKKELANLFRSFDTTILQAQKGIEDLKNASEIASKELQARIDKAEILIDDIKFLNKKSLEIGKRLDMRAMSSGGMPIVNADIQQQKLTPEQVKALKTKSVNKQPKVEKTTQKTKERAKALEGLLETLAEKRNNIQVDNKADKNNYDSSYKNDKPIIDPKSKKEMSVAEVLKSLGYGEN